MIKSTYKDISDAATNFQNSIDSVSGKIGASINKLTNALGDSINRLLASFGLPAIFKDVGVSPHRTGITGGLAGGGSFAGWAMVGDAPGGGVTPFTEYVYAPHGATVYNQSQMSGHGAPPMAGGGHIGGLLTDADLRKLTVAFRDAMLKAK